MSVQPAYAAIPILEVVNFATANTNRDGTGTIATLATGEAPGARVEKVSFKATGNTTAGVIRIFVKEAVGDTWRLLVEILVTAITPDTATESWSGSWEPTNGFNLGLGHMIGVSTHNAETFNAVLQGGRL